MLSPHRLQVAGDAADTADAALAFESDDAGRRRLQYKPEATKGSGGDGDQ